MKFLVESAQNTYHAYHGTRSEFKRFEQLLNKKVRKIERE